MIYLALTALFLIALFVRERSMDRERKAWESERRELLNRVQVPHFVPQPENGKLEPPKPVPFDPGAWGQEPEID